MLAVRTHRHSFRGQKSTGCFDGLVTLVHTRFTWGRESVFKNRLDQDGLWECLWRSLDCLIDMVDKIQPKRERCHSLDLDPGLHKSREI